MSRAEFERLVAEAMTLIPRRFRREIKNLAIVVEDEPSDELLEDMEIEPPDTLFGLYHGTPLTERTWGFGNSLPDRISIYQGPIEDACEGDEDEMRVVIGETLIHEVGHYFGMSEEQIEEIEERYWRAQEADADVDEEGQDASADEDEPQDRDR
jgi:predicted Zn-dependent protease with MMP-like domain